ncbi:hypothetical protein BA939_14400 [Rhizobium sp. S41]|nr:hypothetical protein BA939_14400 [Rhizobium sp. S41]KGE79826.1 hypothetical protein LW14_26835 [Rhizobium sp. H41]
MKASTLINKLQQLISEHGDLPVNFDACVGDYSISEIAVYDRNGNLPSMVEPASEFYIHLATAPIPPSNHSTAGLEDERDSRISKIQDW